MRINKAEFVQQQRMLLRSNNNDRAKKLIDVLVDVELAPWLWALKYVTVRMFCFFLLWLVSAWSIDTLSESINIDYTVVTQGLIACVASGVFQVGLAIPAMLLRRKEIDTT